MKIQLCLAVLILSIFAVGCGKSDSNNHASGAEPLAEQEQDTVQIPQNSRCARLPGLDQVSRNWKRIEASDLITGADRVYRLATSRASITRMGEGPLVTLNYTAGEVKLDCSDLPADSRVSFQYDMVMSFSAKDGSFVRPDGTGASVAHLVAGLQRTRMTAPKVGLKVETYAISRFSDVLRGQGFADILTHQPRLDPAARPEVRVYQVSSNEVEVRLEIPVNISGDGGARVDTLAIINRYGL